MLLAAGGPGRVRISVMAEEPLDKSSYRAAEVCKVAGLAPYVLRYWQTEFPCLAADKDKGSNRLFSSKEVRVISRIKTLLYEEGFTIAGAKKKIDAEIAGGAFEGGARTVKATVANPAAPASEKPPAAKMPGLSAERKKIAAELKEILHILDAPAPRPRTR